MSNRIKILFLSAQLLFACMPLHAQHCPWDCSGLIMIRSDIGPAEMKKLHLVLTDANKQVIIDTLYGTTEKNTDTCYISWGDDFLAHKTSMVASNHWYAYDTMLHFCRGYYVVRYNYCKYQEEGNRQLFIRYTDAKGVFHYLPVPDSNRIHLHNYNDEIRNGQIDELKRKLEPFVIKIGKEMLRG